MEGSSEHEQRFVDLSKVQNNLATRTHAKPNFPNVLAEYGLEEKENKAQKEIEKKMKKKKKVEKLHVEFDKSVKKTQLIEERYRQVMEDVHKRQNMSTVKYRKKKGSSDDMDVSRRPPSQKGQEERELLVKPRVKLEHHTLITDDSFLEDLPKTDMARIVELQDRLMREGKLKTQSDVDKFWQDIQEPSIFYSYFKIQKQTAPISLSEVTVHSNHSNQTKPPDSGGLQLPDGKGEFRSSHISESYNSISSTHHQWAVTHQYKYQHAQISQPSNASLTRLSSAKLAAIELERRCPKLEMPKLHCFTMDLSEKPPDPAEIQRGTQLKIRQKQRKIIQRKLLKMHQLAMANGASANRILENKPELTQFFEDRSLKDVISVLAPQQIPFSPEEDQTNADFFLTVNLDDSDLIHLPHLPHIPREDHSLISAKTEKSGFLSVKVPSSRKRRSKSKSAKSETPEKPVAFSTPLMYDDVLEQGKVMEARCLSTLWTNYLQVGKSLFSQT